MQRCVTVSGLIGLGAKPNQSRLGTTLYVSISILFCLLQHTQQFLFVCFSRSISLLRVTLRLIFPSVFLCECRLECATRFSVLFYFVQKLCVSFFFILFSSICQAAKTQERHTSDRSGEEFNTHTHKLRRIEPVGNGWLSPFSLSTRSSPAKIIKDNSMVSCTQSPPFAGGRNRRNATGLESQQANKGHREKCLFHLILHNCNCFQKCTRSDEIEPIFCRGARQKEAKGLSRFSASEPCE